MDLALRQNEQVLPEIEDFEVLKDAFLLAAHAPDALVRPSGEDGLWFKVERLYADLDLFYWPPSIVCITGVMRTIYRGNTMAVRYRELPCHSKTINSSVNHDYIMATDGGEVVKAVQSIRGCPEINEPPVNRQLGRVHAKQSSSGARILKRQFSTGLTLTAGDCGVLFDRLMSVAT